MTRKDPAVQEVVHVAIDAVEHGEERRSYIDPDEFAGLVHSIGELGLQEPLRVARTTPERFVCRRGNVRLKACREAGLSHVLCYIDDRPMDDATDVLEWLAIKDQRTRLNPIDRGVNWAAAMRLNGWTQSQLASHLKITQGMVSRLLRLTEDDVPQNLQDKVRCGEIPPAIAYDILHLPTKKERDAAILAGKIVKAKPPAPPDKKKLVFEDDWETPKRGRQGGCRIYFVGRKKTYSREEIIRELQALLEVLAGPRLADLGESEEASPDDDGPTILPTPMSA